MKAALPERENERLAALHRYNVLDTPPEQAFDDLALLAAQICQVPTAMVSLVDEKRQWFKSRIGMKPTETTRDMAFCAHTILHVDEVLEVRDAAKDPRFLDNPLVIQDPHIRFYAGAPLVSPDGHALGALCVMDRTPRTLTPEQLAALRALGRHVVSQLELKRQAKALLDEVVERRRVEELLRKQYDQLAANKTSASELLVVAEQSRRALLSVIEDEKQAGQKLRDSEERFRQLAENINEVFWMTDPTKNKMLYISPAYESIWGRTCESWYANPSNWLEAIHGDDRERVIEAMATRQASGDYDEIYRIVRADGGERWIRDRAYPVKDEKGSVYRIVGTAEDVTDRKRAELRTAVQHAVTGVLSEAAPLVETSRRILEIVCRQLSWDLGELWTVDRATRNLRLLEIWHPPSAEFRPLVNTSRMIGFALGEGLPGLVWATKEPQFIADLPHAEIFRRRTQSTALGLQTAVAFPIKLRNEVFGVVEFFSKQARQPDAATMSMFSALGTQIGQFIERKQFEEQFRQAQKMEAIGTLAGGIAHDFNNVLAAIVGYTELAKMEVQDNPLVLEYLQAVSEGGGRATNLVRQILAFSRQEEHQRAPIPLWPVLEEALKLLRATIPSTIQFEVVVSRRGPQVMADPTQVHQIVMNLATNAAHAMKHGPGRLGIGLETVQVDTDLAALHPGLRPGEYQRLAVTDSGHGMDEATLSRIFDPFFTTKAPGEGTGLGLAVVHGIMQSHDGVISVYSQPGEGTRFHLYFPAYAGKTAESPPEAAKTPRGHGQHILVVDDEVSLALMGKKILERLGYVVDAKTIPADAINAVRADPAKYALVITDLTMPGMAGTDLAKQLLQIRPDLPIILSTGYSATLNLERIQAMGIREMVLKPLTIQSLGDIVHRVIEAGK